MCADGLACTPRKAEPPADGCREKSFTRFSKAGSNLVDSHD